MKLTPAQLDICVYTICENRISRSIDAAHHRGVHVRIITDDKESTRSGSDIVQLGSVGIPIKKDVIPTSEHPGGMMHNKFMVIDNAIVLTGSFNWTRAAYEFNYENFCILSNPHVVASYTQEFNSLWEQGRGARSHVVSHGDGTRAAFFPSEESNRELGSWLEQTKSSLDLCVYDLTDSKLTRILLALRQRNVNIRILTDGQQARVHPRDIQELQREGVPVKMYQGDHLMHHKFAVRDETAALTGSYNWSNIARYDNRENILFLQESQPVGQFRDEFEQLWRIM
ncbi:hypothetical protein HDU93_003599 [Gonapodya sp. JEL0774]|nr:hypothetical protein HDU93_003599 [Gonapodya sp. JEL0774]